MPVTPLVAAIRHNDANIVRQLLSTGVDVNERCEVEPVIQARHESPLYWTTPLFEAVRQRNKEIIAILLARTEIDVNLTATILESTPFCDAVSRGDVELAKYLMNDPRVDGSIGNKVVLRPLLYGCMLGNIEILKMGTEHGLVTDDLEYPLYKTAAANNHTDALHFIENYFIDVRSLDKLTPGRQLVKIRREFAKFDDDGNGFCDNDELRDLFIGMGVPLSESELTEAFMALNTAGDNRIDLDELTSYWLGAEGFKQALAELAASGGYGGFQLPPSAFQ